MVVLYLGVHLVLYAGLLRRLDMFRSEAAIFTYHLLSFAVTSAALVSIAFVGSNGGAAVLIGGMCLHAIYSMSFLEAWSLTEGSLYFRILGQLAHSDAIHILGEGNAHREGRVRSLQRAGLLERDGEVLHLTARGKVAGRLLEFCAWLFAGRAP